MKILTIDTETTYGAHPRSENHRVCWWGFYDGKTHTLIKHDSDGWKEQVEQLLTRVNLLIGFNAKFDLQWLKRYGINCEPDRIWDGQLVEFILSNQQERFPDLDTVCGRYGIGTKLDLIRTEYWDRGVDTPDIPDDVVKPYLTEDLNLHWRLYEAQRLRLEKDPLKARLCSLHNQDEIVLLDMEATGLIFNEDKAQTKVEEVNRRITEIAGILGKGYEGIPLNYDSTDHLSAYLYGGIIRWDTRENFLFVYKDQKKTPKEKTRVVVQERMLPQLYTPIEGSNLQKDGYWSTNERFLRQLRGDKKRLQLILERSELATLRDNFLVKLPKLRENMHWPKNHLYGQYNQCVVITGRTSSSKPNQQNFPKAIRALLETRYS